MRRILLILVAITAVVAVEIVWLAPATLVGSRLERATGGALRLADTEGTIWHARGMLVTERARLPIAWDLAFWPLVRGEARLRIRPYSGATSGPPRADLDLRSGAVTVRDAEILVPAAMVGALAAIPGPWIVGGDVSVVVAALEWAPPANRGEARIVWQRAQLTPHGGGGAVDLGTVTANLTARGDGLSGPVRNEGGVLDVQGELVSRVGEGAAITVRLAPRGSTDPTLASALNALGAVDGTGWRFEGRVPAR